MSERKLVAIMMGSANDREIMQGAADALAHFNITSELKVLSAHRTPKEAEAYAQSCRSEGTKVMIAGAGMAAHLAGFLAGQCPDLPIIGVPLASGALEGKDALYSTVQMPKGVPVATVAINGAWNAGVLAVQMMATGSDDRAQELRHLLTQYREDMRKKILATQ